MRYGLSAANAGDLADRTSFPAQSSVLDEEALFRRIVPRYDGAFATSIDSSEGGWSRGQLPASHGDGALRRRVDPDAARGHPSAGRPAPSVGVGGRDPTRPRNAV